MKPFALTQTSVKDFEKELTCLARWKAQWIDKSIPFQETSHHSKGNYFEWLILGANAKKTGVIPVLAPLRNGEKAAATLRIEQQAAYCKRLLFDPSFEDWLGFTLVSTQKKLTDSDTGREGTLDIEATRGGQPWIIDLKLTGDLSSTRTQYSWGNDWRDLDWLQQLHYQKLYGKPVKMGMLVADYSPKMRVEFAEISFSKDKLDEYEGRFFKVENTILFHSLQGEWPKNPSISECEKCNLVCDKRMKK